VSGNHEYIRDSEIFFDAFGASVYDIANEKVDIDGLDLVGVT